MKYKIKIIKEVFPELQRNLVIAGNRLPEYRCSGCGAIFEPNNSLHAFCPGCGNEINWNKIVDKTIELSSMMIF